MRDEKYEKKIERVIYDHNFHEDTFDFDCMVQLILLILYFGFVLVNISRRKVLSLILVMSDRKVV